MFTKNKYTKYYYNIIENAKKRDSGDEIHHIVPRCIGGNDSIDNLVKLTYREHYIVHGLLTKMHSSKKLIDAYWAMSNQNKNRYYRSRLYESARRQYSEAISGDNHWSKSEEYRKKVSLQWTDERKKDFRLKVSGNNHWTNKTDMRDHCKKMRMGLTEDIKEKNYNRLRKLARENNPMKNPEIAKKLKKPKEKVTCPHCGKVGGKPVMMRYHFEKCKMSQVEFE